MNKTIFNKIVCVILGYISALVGAALVFSLLDNNLTFAQAFCQSDTYVFAFIGAFVGGLVEKPKEAN